MPIPVPITDLNGLIPLGTSYDGQQVHWNTSRHPHALIVAQDPHERAAFTEMLLAAVRTQQDWIYFPLSTSEESSSFGGSGYLEDYYLNARYEQMRKEGVVWYSDSSQDYKKVLVVLEAADTLLPAQERLLNRVLTLGPAVGVTVVAISASQPDWQARTLSNFNLNLAVMDYEEEGYSGNNGWELVKTHRKLGFKITGPNASILKAKDTYTPVRFYGMPE